MLRLVNTFGHGLPASFLVHPNATFSPGMVAQLIVADSQVVATVSDGTAPIGIIDDIRDQHDDSTKGTNRMTVWGTRMIFQTDMYDHQAEYPLNANLYVEHGLFTTRRPSLFHPAVAMITCPLNKDGVLELMWF
jgi:hypothetical protein